MSSKVNDQQVGGDHYKKSTGKCPHCGGIIQHWDLYGKASGLVYAATKYLTRHREKNGREDVEKAIHYATKILEQEYGSADALFVESPEYQAAVEAFHKRTT